MSMSRVQRNLDRYVESICSLRSVISGIQHRVQFNGFHNQFDVGYEFVTLETALGLLYAAEDRFFRNSLGSDIRYGRVQGVFSRALQAIRLSERTRSELERQRAEFEREQAEVDRQR